MSRRLIVPRTNYAYDSKPSRTGARVTKKPKISGTTERVRERSRFPWTPVLRIGLIAIMVFLIIWAVNSPLFLVRNTVVQGAKSISETSIQAVLPSHQNLWLYPVTRTVKRIKSVSPLIADTAISRNPPNTIRVVIAERVQALDWESDGKHYVLGLDGTIILDTAPTSPLPHLIDTTKLTPHIGQAVATPGFVHVAQDVYAAYPKIFAGEIDHLEIGETIFDLTLVPKSGPHVLLESTRDISVQLIAAKKVADQFKDQIKEYIDMRVPAKAYYK